MSPSWSAASGPPARGLGRYVPDHESVRRTREAPVGDECDLVREALADDRAGHVQHLAHARPARGPFVADHDHVARLDGAGLHRREARLLGVEHASRTAVLGAVVAGELDDAPFRREVAAENRDAPAGFQRRRDRHDDGLARGLLDRLGNLVQRTSVDGGDAGVDERAVAELARDEPHAAGAVDVRCVVAAPRLHVGHDRRRRRDAVEVVDREVDAELARDGDEVEDAVRRAARTGDRGSSVLDRLLRHDRRRAPVVPDDVDGEPADLVRRLGLRAVHGRDPVRAQRCQAEEVDHRGHRVRGELAAAGSRGRTGDRLELVQLLGAHLPGRVRADRLVDVADRHFAAAVETGRDRARVEDDGRDVEARERHDGTGRRLVAGDEAHETVEEVAARDELDGVGDHLARDERRTHPGRAHRDPVRDRDRVELHRRGAGVADAALHVDREVALIEIARHRLDPRRGDADDGLGQVVVGEARPLEHRACARAVGAVGEGGADALRGIGRCVVRVARHSA